MFLKHLVISFTLLIYEIETKGGHLIECETAKGCVESMKKLGIEVLIDLKIVSSRKDNKSKYLIPISEWPNCSI